MEVTMKRSTASAVGLIAAGALAGGVLAGTLSANAAGGSNGTNAGTDTGTTAPAYAGPTATGPGAPPQHGLGPDPVRGDESSVGSNLTDTLTQKAEAKTGGTVYRVETDSGDAAYEAHVQKDDGSLVTVKFDKNGTITAVEDGMGR
jgi:hypothetical protein